MAPCDISSGTDDDDSMFEDASESGGDVFFTTRARLVERDQDNLVDLYDARVGGDPAFGKLPIQSGCAGDSCNGKSSATGAPLDQPATANVKPGNDDRPQAKRPKAKRKCKKGHVRKRDGEERGVKKGNSKTRTKGRRR